MSAVDSHTNAGYHGSWWAFRIQSYGPGNLMTPHPPVRDSARRKGLRSRHQTVFVSGRELVARELNPTRQLKSDRHFTPPPAPAQCKGVFGGSMDSVLRRCSSVSVPRREQVVLCDFALNHYLLCAIVGPFFPFFYWFAFIFFYLPLFFFLSIVPRWISIAFPPFF